MTPHVSPDLALEDFLIASTIFTKQMAALEPETIALAEEAILNLMRDIVTYMIACMQGRLSELLQEDPGLTTLGDVLMGRHREGGLLEFGNLLIGFVVEQPSSDILKFPQVAMTSIKRKFNS